MRKITKQATMAFLSNEKFKQGNTRVVVLREDGLSASHLLLHDNPIAIMYFKNGRATELHIRNAGWFSNTTKERLNALPGVNIYQKDWQWYLNGEQWNGQSTKDKF